MNTQLLTLIILGICSRWTLAQGTSNPTQNSSPSQGPIAQEHGFMSPSPTPSHGTIAPEGTASPSPSPIQGTIAPEQGMSPSPTPTQGTIAPEQGTMSPSRTPIQETIAPEQRTTSPIPSQGTNVPGQGTMSPSPTPIQGTNLPGQGAMSPTPSQGTNVPEQGTVSPTPSQGTHVAEQGTMSPSPTPSQGTNVPEQGTMSPSPSPSPSQGSIVAEPEPQGSNYAQCFDGKQCPDGSCVEFDEPCPCAHPQRACYDISYGHMGTPDVNFAGATCVDSISDCSCTGSGALSMPCTTENGDYECKSSAWHTQCPVVCNQMTCYERLYDSFGNPDYYTMPNSTGCADYSVGCPCNPTWEHKCMIDGSAACFPISIPCPIECGTSWPCSKFKYYANGSIEMDELDSPQFSQVCPQNGSCPCNLEHELNCNGECLPKVLYEECPIECGSRVTCLKENFDSDGSWRQGEEVCKESWDECAEVCAGTNAKRCPGASYCQWIGEECPVVCTADQQECWTENYDNGTWSAMCVSMYDACPGPSCGSTGRLCPGFDYCMPGSEECPLDCAYDQQMCHKISYNANGTEDQSAAIEYSCVAQDDNCPCGSNTQSCGEFGCLPLEYDGVKWSCPVMCAGNEHHCLIIDYDAAGNMNGYRETCAKDSSECTCGTNSTRCKGEWGSWCEPTWDSYANAVSQCPVLCDVSTEQHCFVPTYDAFGFFLTSTEYCAPIGTGCDCSRGQNNKNCSSLGECLPVSGLDSYCPPSCADNQVACPPVEEYDPNSGEFLKWKEPSPQQQCQSTESECPCGSGSRKCSDGSCVPSVFPCDVTCMAEQQLCEVADLDSNGTVTKFSARCIGSNATCACGKNSKKCAIDDYGILTYVCLPECPCKQNQQTCEVLDFDKKGRPTGWSTKCIGLGSQCPCGTNSKTCSNPQDPSEKECRPKFRKEAGECPKPCTLEQELQGNKTCNKINVDSNTLMPVSDSTTCEASCSPGRGQKVCAHGAVILTGYPCKDLYRVKGKSRRLTGALQVGDKQMASLSFTLKQLVSSSTDSSKMKLKLDSILQLTPQLKSTLVIKIKGSGATSEASMQYKVTNQGVSTVAPKKVTSKLREMLNKRDVGVKKVLAALGKVKMGKQGCCSSATQSKKRSVIVVTTAAPIGSSTANNIATSVTASSLSVGSGNGVSVSQVPAQQTTGVGGGDATGSFNASQATTEQTTSVEGGNKEFEDSGCVLDNIHWITLLVILCKDF